MISVVVQYYNEIVLFFHAHRGRRVHLSLAAVAAADAAVDQPLARRRVRRMFIARLSFIARAHIAYARPASPRRVTVSICPCANAYRRVVPPSPLQTTPTTPPTRPATTG